MPGLNRVGDKRGMGQRPPGRASLTAESSLKRLAWGFGTAKAGSVTEREALDLLLVKVQHMLKEPAP